MAASDAPPMSLQSVAGWATVGVSGAALGAAVALHLLAADSEREANAMSLPSTTLSDQSRKAHYDAALADLGVREAAAWAMTGVAAAAAVTGALLLVLDGPPDDDGEPLSVAPWPSAGPGGGLVVHGRF